MQQPPQSPPEGSDEGLGIRDLVGLGGVLVGAVVLGTLIGWGLDQALGTDPALTLIGLAIGIAAGVAGCWAQVRRYLA
jgi:F0F1-type ATP synthase assembly protein I